MSVRLNVCVFVVFVCCCCCCCCSLFVREKKERNKKKMPLYLVFTERQPTERLNILGELVKTFVGPFVSCKLVFVNDLSATELMITFKPPLHPFYRKTEVTKTSASGKFELRWYEINVNYEQRCTIERYCNRIVKEKLFRMSQTKFLGTTLPEIFHCDALMKLILPKPHLNAVPITKELLGNNPKNLPLILKTNDKDTLEFCENKEAIPIHCSGLVAHVLQTCCPDVKDIPLTGTATDLFVYLMKKKKLTYHENIFNEPKYVLSRDGGGFKRSHQTIMEEKEEENYFAYSS